MTTTDNQEIPAGPPRRRHKSKLRTVFTIFAIVVVGASIGWLAARYLTSQVDEPESAALALPRVAPASPAGKPRSAVEDTVQPDAVAKGNTRWEAVEVVVGSYGSKLFYPIGEWTLGTAPSGFIDSVNVNGQALGPEAAMPPLRGRDLLELSGWAGDVAVGLRYPYVLISACDQIVAHTPVNLPRPDVAKAVHGNLGLSGWRVTIAAGHLPSCKGGLIKAWGAAPGDQKLLLPLNRHIALSDKAIEPEEKLQFTAAAPPLHAGDLPPIPPAQLNVRAEMLNMRRCAGPDCPVTAQIARGTWSVLVLGESVDWILVALPGRAGWISREYAEVTQGQ